MPPSRALSALALVAPTIAWGSLPSLEVSARDLGARLGRATVFVAPAEDALPSEPDVVSAADSFVPGDFDALAQAPAGKHRARRPRPQVAPGHSLRVSAGTVLRLSRSNVVPVGHTVPALRGRPAGIQVSGVSRLGIGVRDGDVLTEVAGAPVTDAGQVVAMVLAARSRRDSAISAVFYRGTEPWALVVEMPYL